MAVKVLLIFSAFLIAYPYVIYPMVVIVWSRLSPKNGNPKQSSIVDYPHIDLILSVYNEEDIIERKLLNIEKLQYPAGLLSVWIGSDHSTDSTNNKVEQWSSQKEYVTFIPFAERRGKSHVVNDLVQMTKSHHAEADNGIERRFFLFTDASVMAPEDILMQIAEDIDLSVIDVVDIPIIPSVQDVNRLGIGESEKKYLQLESQLKKSESQLWQRCMGVFGGFFLLRQSYFEPVPDGFAVDDFFVLMSAYVSGAKGTLWDNQSCTEPHTGSIAEEYKRKKRISRGNWQNLRYFWPKLGAAPLTLTFSFLSHKVLRWLLPFLMIFHLGVLFTAVIVSPSLWVMIYLSGVVLLIVCVFVWYPLGTKLGLELRTFKNIRYFILMNVALLNGALNSRNNKNGSIWDPPKRK